MRYNNYSTVYIRIMFYWFRGAVCSKETRILLSLANRRRIDNWLALVYFLPRSYLSANKSPGPVIHFHSKSLFSLNSTPFPISPVGTTYEECAIVRQYPL